MSRLALLALLIPSLGLRAPSVAAGSVEEAPGRARYAVVVSRQTHADPAWRRVVDALVAKHAAVTLEHPGDPGDVVERLAAVHPRYTCFVARPGVATRDLVAKVHRLTRALDDDPYTDTLWGILTGFDAEGALRVARHDRPLVVRKVASGTELAMEMVEEGVWYCELKKNRMVQKRAGEEARERRGPDDTTRALVDTLNDYRADLFVTSGHATERNWQIGFRYENGHFRSKAGTLLGQDTRGVNFRVESDNPKVYLPIGNCLMGNIDGPDAMALAWMNKAGVHQMMGYTVPTWFGYGGWGCLDYFVEQPGRYTFTEAFFANHHALIYSIEKGLGHQRGLKFDRDVVAFYGDPAWSARMAERPKAYDQRLTESGGVFTFTVTGRRGADSFKPVNTNGSQRGWRPIVEIFPARLSHIEMLEDGGLSPLIADDFLLIPNPRTYDGTRDHVVRFRARRMVPSGAVATP